MRVLVADKIAQEGIDMLSQCAQVDVKTKQTEEQLVDIIGDYEAMIVAQPDAGYRPYHHRRQEAAGNRQSRRRRG
jgi:phosphoglycerate dehydrogenase-like enzyme